MILCVNANAAIDKTAIVRGFHLNQIHRPEQVLAVPGGKGINVARALKTLAETPVVTGWVGGFAGQFIETGLHAEGIQTAFIHADFESRTCLSILDLDTRGVTEVYEKGDPIPADKLYEFRRQFETTVGNYAAVTFSGSLPSGVPSEFYGELLDIARRAGVPTLLDTSGEPLRLALGHQPLVVKPNRTELGELLGREVGTSKHAAAAARDLVALYHANVVVSLGAEGALATNGGQLVHVRPPAVTIESAVGSGDCLLAGLTYGLIHSFSLEEAVKYGVAAGTANALSVGAGRFTRDDLNRILTQITVTHY